MEKEDAEGDRNDMKEHEKTTKQPRATDEELVLPLLKLADSLPELVQTLLELPDSLLTLLELADSLAESLLENRHLGLEAHSHALAGRHLAYSFCEGREEIIIR